MDKPHLKNCICAACAMNSNGSGYLKLQVIPKKIDKSYIDHSNFFPIGMTLTWTNLSIYVCNHWVGLGVNSSEHLLPISSAQHLEYVFPHLPGEGC